MLKHILAMAILASAMLLPLSAGLYTSDFIYSYQDGDYLGLDFTASSDSVVHGYGGMYGQIGLDSAKQDFILGFYFGPGFMLKLNQSGTLMIEIAAALDMPICWGHGTTGIGLGVMGDIGVRWKFASVMMLTGGLKGGYYFGCFGFDTDRWGFYTDLLPRYRIAPYIGIGMAI